MGHLPVFTTYWNNLRGLQIIMQSLGGDEKVSLLARAFQLDAHYATAHGELTARTAKCTFPDDEEAKAPFPVKKLALKLLQVTTLLLIPVINKTTVVQQDP